MEGARTGGRAALNSALRARWEDDRYMVVVSVLLIAKVLLCRALVLSHAFGPGIGVDLVAAFAVLALGYSLGGSAGRRAVAIAYTLFSALLLAGSVYAAYFEQLPSLRMLASAWQLFGVAAETKYLLRPAHLLLVIDLPIVLYLGFRRPAAWPSSPRAATVGALSLVLVSGAAVNAAARQPIDSLDCSYKLGMVAYEASTLVTHLEPADKQPIGAHELQDLIDSLTGHADGDRRQGAPAPGSMRGKNLIMIQVEALQAGVLGGRIEGQPIMPNLERLVGSSTYFPNTYSQIGRGNTSDAEFVANTSLYPGLDQPASVEYGKKALPALPRLLRKHGYYTFTMHTNDARFWNRFQLYPALGFHRYYDRSFFGTADFTEHGASDRVLFTKSLPVIERAERARRPFYAQLVTVSSHYPYIDAAEKGRLELPEDVRHTETGRYLETLSYTDEQIGVFLDKLEDRGILNDTVLVVYGDHFGLRFDRDTDLDRSVREQLYGHGYNRADFYNIPLIVRVPGQAPDVDETVVGQTDIMPTIADLFGLDLSLAPHFGKSAYVESPTLLTRPSTIPTYIDGYRFFLSGVAGGEDRWYDARSQVKLESGVVPARLNDIKRLIEVSHTYASGLPERLGATDEVGEIPFKPEELDTSAFR